jgi:peptide deformylase
MILPIYAYGQPVLRQVAQDITPDHPSLETFLANMWETMYHSKGVGLAAPQVGESIRVFVVDTVQLEKSRKNQEKGIKQVFINAHFIEETGAPWSYEEGCLSIPDIHGDVVRPSVVRLRWLDEHFQPQEGTFEGMNARVIQHEYDHLEGILFTDHLQPLAKRLNKNRLEKIRTGQISPDYKMKFARY